MGTYKDPGCPMKCCCPPCSVVMNKGTDAPLEIVLAFFIPCYTLICWSPATEKPGGTAAPAQAVGAPAQQEMS